MSEGQLKYASGLPVAEIRHRSGLVVWSSTAGGPPWCDADLREAVLDDMTCDGGIVLGSLVGASLKRCDLYWLHASASSFVDADLEDCIFRGCNLSVVDFSGARLRRTRFLKDNLDGRTDLSGANLSAAQISDADFSGAEYDDASRFPPGFDPLRHGMTRAKP